MGNDFDENKDSIIWIDQNVVNKENKTTYETYKPKLLNYNFICFKSVQKAFKFIKKKKNYFEFRLFYTIVSGRLAEEFYTEYVKFIDDYNIISANIVYCMNQEYHEKKPYFKDNFLNTGKITVNFDEVIEYILKNEYNWENIKQNYQEYNTENEKYGDVFLTINTKNEHELHLAIVVGKLINSSLIEKGEIEKFQDLLFQRYCKAYDNNVLRLIKPSYNKNINVPLHLLTKAFFKFYTEEGYDDHKDIRKSFYRDLNKDLTNEKFDDYHPFIFLLYDSLNKGFMKSYRNTLYRGGKLSKTEFENIIKNKTDDEGLFYFSKNFLSFSKDEKNAKNFLKPIENGENAISVLFIIEKIKKDDFFITNIDIENLSQFKNEKEVLVLPMTCFEIVKIDEEEIFNNVKYRKIYLNYLDKYEDEINKKINEFDEKKINEFFTNSMKSKFGESIQKFYDSKNRLNVRYCMSIGASPQNIYFFSQIMQSFVTHLLSMIGKSGYQNAAHLEELPEVLEVLEECKKKSFALLFEKVLNTNVDNFKLNIEFKSLELTDKENYFLELFEKLNINVGYSVGFCIGNFLTEFESFLKAPRKTKIISLVSLALTAGPQFLKIYPNITSFLKNNPLKIGFGFALDGLNILFSLVYESLSIYNFSKNHKWNITCKFGLKRFSKLASGFLISLLGNFAIEGVLIIIGVSLAPWATIVIGVVGGIIIGFTGKKIVDKIFDNEKLFGKDEFILTSANLYYKYIPNKYRIKGNNPHLHWNSTYLCSNVKSYIIECIVNEVELTMRVINIPKDVNDLPECLGYYIDKKKVLNDDSDISTSVDNYEYYSDKIKIFHKNKFIGDLTIPYNGVKENAYRIDFIIYGINQNNISEDNWESYKNKGKIIEIISVLSVY